MDDFALYANIIAEPQSFQFEIMRIEADKEQSAVNFLEVLKLIFAVGYFFTACSMDSFKSHWIPFLLLLLVSGRQARPLSQSNPEGTSAI